jgi:hypothetical protein
MIKERSANSSLTNRRKRARRLRMLGGFLWGLVTAHLRWV